MTLLIYARRDLVDQVPRLPEPVLLEGSWSTGDPAERWALDDAIDGRFERIDRKAAAMAEQLVDGRSPAWHAAPAYLDALALRYYLTKLMRVVTFFTELHPIQTWERVEFVGAEHDRDYAELIEQLCDAAGAECHVRLINGCATASPKQCRTGKPARSTLWRRGAERISRLLSRPPRHLGACRVVLCGSPRLLDPVCRELLARKCEVWWLYDRFAVKSWLRWRSAGVSQLVCDSSEGRANRLGVESLSRLDYCGVDLAPAVARWLDARVAAYGPRHTRLLEQIATHFGRVRPDVLVLDEDATPMARAAVAVGRQQAAQSLVVQHGAPCCRFGFAPLVADRIAVWGRSSKETLTGWGVNPEQIRITGAPSGQVVGCDNRDAGPPAPTFPSPDLPPRILLLATTPPRDERPDAAALNLNRRTYTQMLRMAFATVAGIDNAKLIVKLHPRASRAPIVRQVRAEFPKLCCRIVRRGPMEKHLAGADVVLSCGSTAGIEAAAAGLPVIQLLPPGSKDFLPHEKWGMLGTARRDAELQRLLVEVLVEGWQPSAKPNTDVFATTGQTAAARIADEAISLSESSGNTPIELPKRHTPQPAIQESAMTKVPA